MAEEEVIKKKAGRPRKAPGDTTTASYVRQTKNPKGWGGKREGAGNRAKGADGPLTSQDVFRVTADTHRRIKALRELTAQDDKPFNRMFELWVEDLAKDYGID